MTDWIDWRILLPIVVFVIAQRVWSILATRKRSRIMDRVEMWALHHEMVRKRMVEQCDICSGRASVACPQCGKVVAHSHEDDYACDEHGFVNPVWTKTDNGTDQEG